MTTHEKALRALAQAYDREDAAQRGEPDPWNLDDPGDIGDSDTWVSERLACAQVAAEAFLSAILPEDAAGLVERLRQYEGRDPLLAEAAAAIERLVRERDEARGSHLVEEGSTQSDEYTELALALTAAEARASSAEAQLAEMREALRKIVSCYDRNWQHQREKLDDIVPMARAALEQSQ